MTVVELEPRGDRPAPPDHTTHPDPFSPPLDVYPFAGRVVDFNSKRAAPHEPVFLADGALLLRSQLGDLCVVWRARGSEISIEMKHVRHALKRPLQWPSGDSSLLGVRGQP